MIRAVPHQFFSRRCNEIQLKIWKPFYTAEMVKWNEIPFLISKTGKTAAISYEVQSPLKKIQRGDCMKCTKLSEFHFFAFHRNWCGTALIWRKNLRPCGLGPRLAWALTRVFMFVCFLHCTKKMKQKSIKCNAGGRVLLASSGCTWLASTAMTTWPTCSSIVAQSQVLQSRWEPLTATEQQVKMQLPADHLPFHFWKECVQINGQQI